MNWRRKGGTTGSQGAISLSAISQIFSAATLNQPEKSIVTWVQIMPRAFQFTMQPLIVCFSELLILFLLNVGDPVT